MSNHDEITGHYSKGVLLERLRTALIEDGTDPDRPTIADLAPHDQFHGRGLEATNELADSLTVAPSDHLLDVGSGIGGPARYISDRFGCRISGIDLTAEFCDVATHLTGLLGLDDRVGFRQGDALQMPFADESFDGAYSMNVSMNIADKPAFYREVRRVLRPGAWLVLSEVAQGPGAGLRFPAPWARTADSSFLISPSQTEEGLEASGFIIEKTRDTTEEALKYGARSRELVERGEKPPHRAVHLIHGETASEMMANMAVALGESGIIPIEIFCRKPAAV